MSTLRSIRPMRELLVDKEPESDLGQKPELRWIAPTDILVDASYQRDLTDRSRHLIRRAALEFAWRKMKPPICVDTEDGLHCVDGQHTAIAAATRGLEAIPVFVVGGTTVQERADSFVAHNRNRIVMTSMDVFRAKCAAMDPDALDVANVCRRAGVNLKIGNQQARVDIGDCAAIGKISGLVKRQGVQKARMVLEALVQGGRAPIGAAEIDATEAAMLLVRPQTTTEEMTRVIRALSDHGVIEAKAIAASDGKPHKHVLFEKYIELLEKQTGVHRVAAA